ncbi:hypothetical protein [Martelella soudanensis]
MRRFDWWWLPLLSQRIDWSSMHEIDADEAGECERLTDDVLAGLCGTQNEIGDERHAYLDAHGIFGSSHAFVSDGKRYFDDAWH